MSTHEPTLATAPVDEAVGILVNVGAVIKVPADEIPQNPPGVVLGTQAAESFRRRPPTPFEYDDGGAYYSVEPSHPFSIPSQNIPKLNDRNYKTWCRDMEFVLRRLHVWDIINDTTPPVFSRSSSWDKKNILALSEIHFACEPHQQRLFFEESIAKKAWEILRITGTNDSKSFIEIKQMTEAFERLCKTPLETCHMWIRRVKDAALDLSSEGKVIDEEDIAYKLLSGLPDEYRPLRTAIMALRTDVLKLSVTTVSAAILMEETSIPSNSPTVPLQHAHKAISTNTDSNRSDSSRSNDYSRDLRNGPYRTRRYSRRYPYARILCHFCKRDNHVEDNCYLKYPEKHPSHPNYKPPLCDIQQR